MKRGERHGGKGAPKLADGVRVSTGAPEFLAGGGTIASATGALGSLAQARSGR
jgi:hypothetical protein